MKWTSAAAWFLVYTLLAVAMTFPLSGHLTSVVPHDLGDPLLSVATLWWNAHVLPLTERWWNGFAFFPAHGTIAFSDHRLGASLIASPLQWLGLDVVAAYNVTWLATFPLCAIAAHALAFTLTGRHDAAALCGLAYGFNPYRVAHLEHLELLAAFGMPAALAALHRYAATRRVRWLVAFALAMIVQGLCASYYLLFFSVFVGLWVAWFVRWRDRRPLLGIVAAWASSLAVLLPLAIGYWRVHRAYGFSRTFGESVGFSADVTSLVTASPLLKLWGWTARLNPPEKQIFPGLTIAAIAFVGAAVAWRRRKTPRDRFDLLSTALLLISMAFAIVAAATAVHGAPWQLTVLGLTMSVGTVYKPASLAVAALFGAIATSSLARDALRRRSPLAFYLFATALLFLCSFGPKPTFLGTQVLYEPPYSWLMRLPMFGESVRVPARFAMPAVLALAVSGALAFCRLRLPERRRIWLAAALMAGIVADGWPIRIPLPRVPEMWPAIDAHGARAVLELPMRAGFNDFAAMYRTTRHRLPTVDGESGYAPPHYTALELAVDEGDETAFDAVAQSGPVLVVVDKQLDVDGRSMTFVKASQRTTTLATDDRWALFSLAPAIAMPTRPACSGVELPVAAALDNRGAVGVGALTDHNPQTFWATPVAQHAGETLLVDLGHAVRICSVRLSLADAVPAFPRLLTIATSLDRDRWESAFTGKTGGMTVRAALEQPREIWLEVPVESAAARYLRFRLEANHATLPWLVADVMVIGRPLPAATSR